MTTFNAKPNVLPNLMWIMDRVFKFTNFGIVSILHQDFFIISVSTNLFLKNVYRVFLESVATLCVCLNSSRISTTQFDNYFYICVLLYMFSTVMFVYILLIILGIDDRLVNYIASISN